jgi:hypothetical protein
MRHEMTAAEQELTNTEREREEAERKNEDHLANVIRRMFLALQESD